MEDSQWHYNLRGARSVVFLWGRLACLSGDAPLTIHEMRFLVILSYVFLSCSSEVFAEPSDALAVQRILERYTESLGGSRAVEALSSLSIEGTQIQNGKSFEFLMRKKRSHSIRYRLNAGATSIVCGYNGRSGWQRTQVGDEVTIKDLPSSQLTVLRDEADFDSPLFRHLEKSWNAITLLGEGLVDGEPVNVLEVTKQGKPFMRYYLSARSGLILKREQLNADGTPSLETLYRDYREVDGCQFAFEVENRIGDQQVSLVKIETIEVNPGLLSFYFEKPRN
ncbi:Unannotated [Lentimonas sp. CC4]|nr:Unannotated [Lentimonas sp. CC4]CAA6683696.1 Unannotated [Lentimonas sp. CC6]CAA7074456.1 Unannotated [Lentimonas sp. CC4]CAA7169066.1 Unannotated [Lentimonas sp. CC21]CAA7180526.1 Unannotated [Lentimonas sp. CC8]